MTSSSSVLVVGHPEPHKIDFGVAMAPHFSAAESLVNQQQLSVIAFSAVEKKKFEDFCQLLSQRQPQALWLVVSEGLSPSQVIQITRLPNFFALVDSYTSAEFENKLRLALEASGERAQRQKLFELFQDQKAHLQRLREELEIRVRRRQRNLFRSKGVVDATNLRLRVFHDALTGIHRATNVSQMEMALNESVGKLIPGILLKVRFAHLNSPGLQNEQGLLTIDIPFTPQTMGGQLAALPREGAPLLPDQIDFLHELTEALALALSRLERLQQAEMIKAQWQATFDAIPHALCLTHADFEIIKLNRSFQLACHPQPFRHLIGANCFKAFFADAIEIPPVSSEPFTLRASRRGTVETEHYEVVGETLKSEPNQPQWRLILLRNITEEVRFERRIVASTKLAELGTIGSSIAHELNNPLGGMLSFLQLILMDVKSDDVLYGDIKAMEQATLRCRDIVLNLLSFARKQDLGDFNKIDLREVIEQAIKLIELQSKSRGIEVTLEKRPRAAQITGSFTALAQSFCNILQNAIDSIAERLQSEPLFPGRIKVSVGEVGDHFSIEISDNGLGISHEVQSQIFNPRFTTRDPGLFNGMGLTTAFTIISEHRGTLEIISQTGSGTTAMVLLPRLDLSPERRNFDGEI